MSDLTADGSGVDLERLRGQDNYHSWSQDFQLLAELKGVWELYTGDEVALNKPNREQYGIKKLNPVTNNDTGEVEMIDKPNADTSAYIAQYKLELEEYDRNHKKVRLARALLGYWVDKAIRGQIIRIDSPKEQSEWLKRQYKMHGTRALDLALARYENCTIDQFKDAQSYINALTAIRNEIKEHGENIKDAQLISKLIRGLEPSPHFAAFLDQYYYMQGIPGVDNTLDSVTGRILTYESKTYTANAATQADPTAFAAYRQRFPNAGKQHNKDSSNRTSANNSPSPSRGGRDNNKVKCVHCNKWHAGICYQKFPEIKAELDRIKNQVKSSGGANNSPDSGNGASGSNNNDGNKAAGKPPKHKKIIAAAVVDKEDFLSKLAAAKESQGWIKVTKPAKNNSAATATTVTTANRFDLLPVEEPENEVFITEPVEGITYAKGPTANSYWVTRRGYNQNNEAIEKKRLVARGYEDNTSDTTSSTADITKGTDSPHPTTSTCETDICSQKSTKSKALSVEGLGGAVSKGFNCCIGFLGMVLQGVAMTGIQLLAQAAVPLPHRSTGIKMSRNIQSRIVFLAASGSPVHKDTWIIDSGANTHVANDTKWFTDYLTLASDISTADKNGHLHIAGGGDTAILLKDLNGDDPTELVLSDVAHAPSSRCNLLSLSALINKANLEVYVNRQGMRIHDQHGNCVGWALEVDGLYHLKTVTQHPTPAPHHGPDHVAMMAESDPTVNDFNFENIVWKWHRKLGHLSLDSMAKLVKQADGFPLTEKQIKTKIGALCPVCATTRALVKIPRDPARRTFQSPGSLLHVDLWGPYPVRGINNAKYFMFFTDDATRYTWCREMTTRKEVYETLKDMHMELERTYDFKVRRYRFDREIYNNNQVKAFCRRIGVSCEPSAAHHHWQNGVAERNMRTMREKTSAIIQDNALVGDTTLTGDAAKAAAQHARDKTISGRIRRIITERSDEMLRNTTLPVFLWPEAIKHSVWLKNRSPAKAHRYRKTPWEALHGSRPDLSKEQIWGSRAYVAIPQELRGSKEFTKLHTPRAKLHYFVGCANESMWRMYNPDNSRVKDTAIANVDDGHGLDDPQDHPSQSDRFPRQPPLRSEQDTSDTSDTEDPSESDDGDDPEVKAQDAERRKIRQRQRLIDDARHRGALVNPAAYPRGLGDWDWLEEGDDDAHAATLDLHTPGDVTEARTAGDPRVPRGDTPSQRPVVTFLPDHRYFNPDELPEGEGQFEYFTTASEELAITNYGGNDAYEFADIDHPTATEIWAMRYHHHNRAGTGEAEEGTTFAEDIDVVWIPITTHDTIDISSGTGSNNDEDDFGDGELDDSDLLEAESEAPSAPPPDGPSKFFSAKGVQMVDKRKRSSPESKGRRGSFKDKWQRTMDSDSDGNTSHNHIDGPPSPRQQSPSRQASPPDNEDLLRQAQTQTSLPANENSLPVPGAFPLDDVANPPSEDDSIPVKALRIKQTKCGACRRRRAVCKRSEGAEKCDDCIKNQNVCKPETEQDRAVWQARLAKDKVRRRPNKKFERVPESEAVAPEDRCNRCKPRFRCDGGRPCKRCARNGWPCKYDADIDKATPCTRCRAMNFKCTKVKPCSHCKKARIRCQVITNEDSTLQTTYSVVEDDDWLSEDRDECEYCRKRGFACDGGESCFRCVKDKPHTRRCRYRRANGVTHSFHLAPFYIDWTDDRGYEVMQDVETKSNWKKGGKSAKVGEDTSESEADNPQRRVRNKRGHDAPSKFKPGRDTTDSGSDDDAAPVGHGITKLQNFRMAAPTMASKTRDYDRRQDDQQKAADMPEPTTLKQVLAAPDKDSWL